MPQVIQAKCPHCTKVLRIPTDWLAKPIRCKHCKQVFQMKAKAAPAPAAFAAPAAAAMLAVAPPVPSSAVMPQAAVAGARPASNDPFGFDTDDTPTPVPDIARKPRKKGRGVLALVAVFLFLFAAARRPAPGFVVYKAFNTGPGDSKQAKFDGGPGTSGASRLGTNERRDPPRTRKEKRRQQNLRKTGWPRRSAYPQHPPARCSSASMAI